MIRELKDIPIKQVTIAIPAQDFTESESGARSGPWSGSR